MTHRMVFTILLEQKNTIYMGGIMEDPLANTFHSEDNGIHIEILRKKYYPDKYGAHTVTLVESTIIPILYNGFLHYIPVWIPTSRKIDSCLHVAFTSWSSWEPFLLGNFYQFSSSS